ncbi:hypothetical protein MMC07_000002 [Pseudocyphellaria aurata]|nr:hypothetical protein [Pseudocyphellaria aurata]
MHCYFVLPGDPTIPILYHVERVRDGRSFMTRTVQARQKGKSIFTTTCSFMREESGGKKVLEHELPMPDGPVEALQEIVENDRAFAPPAHERVSRMIERQLGVINQSSPNPHTRKTRQWIRAGGRISRAGGQDTHLGALAYMSDSHFIATVPLVHSARRIPSGVRVDNKTASSPPFTRLTEARRGETDPLKSSAPDRPTMGMMVSLDHSIYFHRPREVVADDWLLSENESPWSGEGRGLVFQKIWSKGGRLLATCVQEVSAYNFLFF